MILNNVATALAFLACLVTQAEHQSPRSLAKDRENTVLKPVDSSFLVRDVGDAQALAPLACAMKDQGQKIQILVLGQAALKVLNDDPCLATDLLTPDAVAGVKSRLGPLPDDFGGGQAHDRAFAAPGDAARLAQHLVAPTVISGVVSRAQADIVAAMRTDSACQGVERLIGYYDSLALNKNCYLFHAANLAGSTSVRHAVSAGAKASWAGQFDELWVPLAGLVVGISQASAIDPQRVVAVGSPSADVELIRLERIS